MVCTCTKLHNKKERISTLPFCLDKVHINVMKEHNINAIYGKPFYKQVSGKSFYVYANSMKNICDIISNGIAMTTQDSFKLI